MTDPVIGVPTPGTINPMVEWVAGETYPLRTVLTHNNACWCSLTETTQEPAPGCTDWRIWIDGRGGEVASQAVTDAQAARDEAQAAAGVATQEASAANASKLASAANAQTATDEAAAALASENAAGLSAAAALASKNAADASATAALASKNAATAAYQSTAAKWISPRSSDPTVDDAGNPVVDGATYFNTASSRVRQRSGGVFVNVGTGMQALAPITVKNSGQITLPEAALYECTFVSPGCPGGAGGVAVAGAAYGGPSGDGGKIRRITIPRHVLASLTITAVVAAATSPGQTGGSTYLCSTGGLTHYGGVSGSNAPSNSTATATGTRSPYGLPEQTGSQGGYAKGIDGTKGAGANSLTASVAQNGGGRCADTSSGASGGGLNSGVASDGGAGNIANDNGFSSSRRVAGGSAGLASNQTAAGAGVDATVFGTYGGGGGGGYSNANGAGGNGGNGGWPGGGGGGGGAGTTAGGNGGNGGAAGIYIQPYA